MLTRSQIQAVNRMMNQCPEPQPHERGMPVLGVQNTIKEGERTVQVSIRHALMPDGHIGLVNALAPLPEGATLLDEEQKS